MAYVEWGGIFGTYSSGTKTRQKHDNDTMETTQAEHQHSTKGFLGGHFRGVGGD